MTLLLMHAKTRPDNNGKKPGTEYQRENSHNVTQKHLNPAGKLRSFGAEKQFIKEKTTSNSVNAWAHIYATVSHKGIDLD